MTTRPGRTGRRRTPGVRSDRYSTFLSLSGDAIVRMQMELPLQVETPEDAQVDHILRHSRVAECNEKLFARFYGRSTDEMTGLAMRDFVPSEPERLHGLRQFVRSGYRIAYEEEEHILGPGSSRWISASALGAVEHGYLHDFWVCLREITERKRAELDRERRGQILEAVAFSAARLLQPGTWSAHADEVLARLGQAAQVVRAWIAEKHDEPDGSARLVFRHSWGSASSQLGLEDPRVRDGWLLPASGLERIEAELRAGRPVVTLLSDLPESQRDLPARMQTRSLAAMPIFSGGEWWGLLGFGETRYEREWSPAEIEALKAGGAVLGAAIERERVDSALQESEERFRRLAAATFEGIALTENGIFVDANDQLAAMLRCDLSTLIGQSVERFAAPEAHELLKGQRQSASEAPYEHDAVRSDGSLFPVEVRARHTPYKGRTIRVTAVRDVSARVQAEQRQRALESELRQAADEWRQTFDALDLGIVLANAEGHIVRLNRAALELARETVFTTAVGRKLEELPDLEPWRTLLDLHRRIGQSGTTLTAEAREPANGRSFYLLGSPWFRGENQAPWRVVTFRDVTDFSAMQEQLRRARVMEAMGALVAGVAHEVRNPLFSISATIDALEVEIGRQPEFVQYATLLRAQVGRLTQLMRDLLDYGKPSLLRRTSTQLGDVFRRAVRTCAGLARERHVTVEERLADDLPALDVDGPRIEQALENLLANAIQHAPAASVVRLIGALDGSGSGACCTVEDEGPGLGGVAERIFEPFFTQRKGGTGLGLSIVQRVAEAHGGRVTAETRTGRGARFTMWLPVGAPAARSGRA